MYIPDHRRWRLYVLILPKPTLGLGQIFLYLLVILWGNLLMECSQAAIFNRDVCNIVVTLVLHFRKTLAYILSVNNFFNILSILSR